MVSDWIAKWALPAVGVTWKPGCSKCIKNLLAAYGFKEKDREEETRVGRYQILPIAVQAPQSEKKGVAIPELTSQYSSIELFFSRNLPEILKTMGIEGHEAVMVVDYGGGILFKKQGFINWDDPETWTGLKELIRQSEEDFQNKNGFPREGRE